MRGKVRAFYPIHVGPKILNQPAIALMIEHVKIVGTQRPLGQARKLSEQDMLPALVSARQGVDQNTHNLINQLLEAGRGPATV